VLFSAHSSSLLQPLHFSNGFSPGLYA
jgi:hypothetical protein